MIFTTQSHPYLIANPGSQIPIDKFFNRRILHLNLWDVDGVSHESWAVLREKILKTIADNQIELIVFDRTGEPSQFTLPDGYGPNDLSIRAELEQHCRCVIVTDDFSYFYNPHPDIVFFPYNIWLPATRGVHKYYQFQHTVYDTVLEKTKPIMCLNRNLMWHRLFLFLNLIECSWLDQVEYSFINTLDRMNVNFLKRDLTEFEIEKIKSYSDRFPIRLKSEPRTHRVQVDYSSGANSVNIPVYEHNAINLVTETSVNHGIVLTEKTAKIFMAYQIPILIAAAGANQFLQDVGLDMFSDYIPWKTWDQLADHKVKIIKIVEFLQDLMTSPDDILKTHQQFHARLMQNKQYFHSEEFAKILTDQIRNFKL